ncbi:hypothetical protein RYX36_008445, partial [Vicia faba]
HQTHMVYNREPLINDLPLKLCDNKLKLFFNGTTSITSIDMPNIPIHKFKFKPFVEFLNGDFDVDRLYGKRLYMPHSSIQYYFCESFDITYFFSNRYISLVYYNKLCGH